jgi:hypothetical protein
VQMAIRVFLDNTSLFSYSTGVRQATPDLIEDQVWTLSLLNRPGQAKLVVWGHLAETAILKKPVQMALIVEFLPYLVDSGLHIT